MIWEYRAPKDHPHSCHLPWLFPWRRPKSQWRCDKCGALWMIVAYDDGRDCWKMWHKEAGNTRIGGDLD